MTHSILKSPPAWYLWELWHCLLNSPQPEDYDDADFKGVHC